MREVPGPPSIGWSGAIAGGAVALVIAIALGVGVASAIGALAGGALAARIVGHHGALQGAAAAAALIVGLALVDVLHLAAGTAGGWVASRF